MQIIEFLQTDGKSPFRGWFEGLDTQAATKVITALGRMELGNMSNAKGVGGGVMEFRIDVGPGYRIYFGQDGERLIILLAGGSKQRQQTDIANAQARWSEYKQRKKEGR